MRVIVNEIIPVGNKIAQNTLVQYIQLVLNVLIGLISIRLILRALGDIDYGIYDLVAGVVGLLSFISSSLSQTSVRFLSVALGRKGSPRQIGEVFSRCFWLHIYTGGVLLVLLFVGGFLLLAGGLNIPDERLFVAKGIYLFMLLSLFLDIAITPFKALLVSHERFVYISCVGIACSLLKLGTAVTISVFDNGDKLLLYGILMFFVTLFNSICYVVYALREYRSKMSFRISRVGEMNEIVNFSSWVVLDVLGIVATRQGYSILFNSFFGPVQNAVFALSRQVEGQVYTISSSVVEAMRPQIMQTYGSGDIKRTYRLSMSAGKFGFSMMSLIAIPLLVMMPEVLGLWLGDVPEGTVLFTRLMVVACMLEQLTRGLTYASQASGDIKKLSLCVSIIRTSALPISWILLFLGAPAYVAIVVFLLSEAVGSLARVYIFSRTFAFSPLLFVRDVLLRLILPFVMSLCICEILWSNASGALGMFVVVVLNVVVYVLSLYFLGFTVSEKVSVFGVFSTLWDRCLKND